MRKVDFKRFGRKYATDVFWIASFWEPSKDDECTALDHEILLAVFAVINDGFRPPSPGCFEWFNYKETLNV